MTEKATVASRPAPKRAAGGKAARKRPADSRSGPGRSQKPERPEPAAAAERAPADQQELRSRWQRARQIIRDTVGQEDQHDPRIWERGVYQLWLWLVVELLVVRRDDIEVNDLSAISKMLHEQRKLSLDEAKQLQKTDQKGNGSTRSPQLPEHFGSLIRQIYGANFQDDSAACESGSALSPTSKGGGPRDG